MLHTQVMNMLLKVYAGIIFMLDFVLLLVKTAYFILEAIYLKFLPAKEKSVAGEIVLITGTGHGIGQQLALQFAELGSRVVCWDINKENNDKTVQEILRLGHKAYPYVCDVSNREDVLRVAQKVKEEIGEVSILVNNAGIMPCHPLDQTNPQEIHRIFDINVFAHFWMLEAFLPAMIRNNHGHVVALSSMAGVTGVANLVPYCASKYAVRGLMESLDEELREDPRKLKVHFTTIFPFIVDTGLCQKPRTRFPSLLGLVPPKVAASEIIKATRRNYREHSIPSALLHLNHFIRLFPETAANAMKDFIDSGVDPHDN